MLVLLLSVLLARRADAPVHNFSLVDDEAMMIGWLKAGRGSHCTVDVDRGVASSADEMMMIVTRSGLIERRASGGLDSANDSGGDKRVEVVVNGLAR